MGKHKKEKYGKGAGSLLDSYLSARDSHGGAPPPFNASDDVVPLPESMRASTLLQQIGQERYWSPEQIAGDTSILDMHRLYTVSELRVLSDDSWKEIPLVPLAKDLLRAAIRIGAPAVAATPAAVRDREVQDAKLSRLDEKLQRKRDKAKVKIMKKQLKAAKKD
ncbi:hypothetical protein THASP1DRAFT_23895, partial [Thamnocephalis sphaerospora]